MRLITSVFIPLMVVAAATIKLSTHRIMFLPDEYVSGFYVGSVYGLVVSVLIFEWIHICAKKEHHMRARNLVVFCAASFLAGCSVASLLEVLQR